MDRKGSQVMFISIYAYIFACFSRGSRLRALTDTKVIPYGRVVHNPFLTHILSAVVFPARVWHVIVVPIGLNYGQGNFRRSCT